jgi:predicted Fe-Mo cluster-binding NifX family protein
MTDRTRLRVAVAEQEQQDVLAARLGRAVKFGLFDVRDGEIRGPFYRVRHDNPGDVCDHHAELAALLHDCQAVISGSAGPHMQRRLQALGIDVVATPETQPPLQLVSRYLAGTLTRVPVAGRGDSSRDMQFPVPAS